MSAVCYATNIALPVCQCCCCRWCPTTWPPPAGWAWPASPACSGWGWAPPCGGAGPGRPSPHWRPPRVGQQSCQRDFAKFHVAQRRHYSYSLLWALSRWQLILHVPRAAGVCTLSSHVSRATCLQAGHAWTGFDASGHCFLLSWNNLFMVEEFLLASSPIFSRDTGSKVTSMHKIFGEAYNNNSICRRHPSSPAWCACWSCSAAAWCCWLGSGRWWWSSRLSTSTQPWRSWPARCVASGPGPWSTKLSTRWCLTM